MSTAGGATRRRRDTPTDAGSLAVHWGRRSDVPLELRQRLYPAVFEAFAEDDFARVGIRDISRRSGLSSATIYKYFESKEALLTTVFGELFPFLADEMSKRVDDDRPASENLRTMFGYVLDFYDATPALPITFFITVPLKLWMESGGWRASEVEPVMRRVLAAGQRRGEVDPDLSVGTAMGLFYMYMQREVHNWYLGGRRWKMASRVDRFFPLFWRTVAAPGVAEGRVGLHAARGGADPPSNARRRPDGPSSPAPLKAVRRRSAQT